MRDSTDTRRAVTRATALLLAALTAAGCSLPPSYYAQAIGGQLSLLSAARPVQDWVDDPATPEPLRQRLALATRIRAFASETLALPRNRSYTRYADIRRSSAVWNVFAAPPYSLELHTWCYPVAGCAAYRGYFAREDAQRLADQLARQGEDATVAPVPAYSTLGWLPDPLLSTFIHWPEAELARLVFHELAHQVVYVGGDTRFNESFATCVEQAGLARWVGARQDPELQRQYELLRLRRADVQALVAQTRARLEAVYASGQPPARMAEAKEAAFADLQQRYRALRDSRWGGDTRYDALFLAPWNNARIAAMAAYQDDVPAFDALLARNGGDLPRFYAAVRALADLPRAQRERQLRELAGAGGA